MHRELSDCTDILFCSKNHATKTARQTISNIVKKQLDYAKLGDEDASPEIFKNSFAIFLHDSGVSNKKIQTLLGHANLQTTRAMLNSSKTIAGKVNVADAFKNFSK